MRHWNKVFREYVICTLLDNGWVSKGGGVYDKGDRSITLNSDTEVFSELIIYEGKFKKIYPIEDLDDVMLKYFIGA